MKTFKFILRRINSFLCDLVLAYGLFYLLTFVRPIGFPISAYYFCSVVLYFGAAYWLFHASFMQKIFGIEITKHNLSYALIKITLTGIIPFCITFFLYEFYLFTFLFGYLFVIILLTLLSLPFTKKSLWQWFSGAKIELRKGAYKSKSSVIIPLAVTIALLFLPLFQLNPRLEINRYTLLSKNAFPISMPEKSYYAENIRQYKEEPVNYIMQLFDKYDIVILCERWHSECTQWEFFSKIIMNDTFAAKVQNVFTEIGIIQNQERLNSYMNTHFSTEEDLQRATAVIVRDVSLWPLWNNTNFYDFVLHLHQYNATKDSLRRINLFFTDSFKWNEIKNPIQYDSIVRATNRDSIMAYNLINQYKKLTNKKCLLITNTRHAWNYGKNEASYIFKKFPDKTTVVLINGTTQFLYPAMKGMLDASALEIPDSIWAIDFKNCPLGNIQFDLMPIKHDKCSYKDLFAGMVYCNHPSKWIGSVNYPFILDNYRDILLEKSALLGEKYLNNEKKLIKKGYFDKVIKNDSPFIALPNLLFLSMHSVILLFLFLNLLIKLLSLFFSRKTS